MNSTGSDVVPEGMVYFGTESDLTSLASPMDDEYSVSEDEISEWIKYTNPRLYDKINGMPLPSWSLPSDTNSIEPPLSDAPFEYEVAEGLNQMETVLWDPEDHSGLETQSFILSEPPLIDFLQRY
jgi:hypothetical protein